MKKYVLFLSLIMVLMSCGGEKRKPIYVDLDEATEESLYAQSGDEIIVPFRNENGVKYVAVKVNGVGFEMIFDTGCSGALISVAEANYLYQKGKLTQDDILGTAQSQIADGSVVENMVVNLKEVVINDQILCPNVKATVSANINAPLLLGNEILDRLATIKIDNENETLNFKLK
ncbi:MAG: retroviral-like aspartic protease family protein [Prevotella sp.]|nr:retroviral-like aspartic protease family protein [Prevotella sp.]